MLIIMLSCLLSNVGQRQCTSKLAYGEAAETSQHSMLANACGLLAVRCMAIPCTNAITMSIQFDANKATPGAILARKIYTEAADVSTRICAVHVKRACNQSR